MRASLRHVAELAGVSRVTASNVARGRHEQMSQETRARVQQAMRELDYAPVPQPSMQSRHVETRIIGLVFDNIEPEDYWGTMTFRGLREAAEQQGYDLLTILRAPARWMPDQEELRFLDRRSDGFIFIVPKDRFGVLETLVEHQIPAVTCYNDDAPKGVATVALDNAGAMRLAVEHLVKNGHQRVAHLTWHCERADFGARLKGFRRAARAAGIDGQIVDYRNSDWEQQLIRFVEDDGVTAVVCASDAQALALWNLAEQRGWRVPGDLSITGMDNLPDAAERGLTTVGFCSEDVGRHAVEAVVGLIGGKSVKAKTVVPVSLVQRSSVAPARKRFSVSGAVRKSRPRAVA